MAFDRRLAPSFLKFGRFLNTLVCRRSSKVKTSKVFVACCQWLGQNRYTCRETCEVCIYMLYIIPIRCYQSTFIYFMMESQLNGKNGVDNSIIWLKHFERFVLLRCIKYLFVHFETKRKYFLLRQN